MESSVHKINRCKRILITGSNGFVGTSIYKELVNLGFSNVFLTSSSADQLNHSNFKQADFSDLRAIQDVLAWSRPDFLINTAAISSIEDSHSNQQKAYSVNRDAPVHLAIWCKENQSRLVHFSTDFVFNGTRIDLSESDEPCPLSVYGKSKLAGEIEIERLDSNSVIIRPILVYGEKEGWHRHNFLTWLREAFVRRGAITITADQERQPTFIGNLVEATIDLCFSFERGIIHISGGETINMMDFAIKLAKIFGGDPTKLKSILTDDLGAPEQRPLHSGFDLAKAKSVIGFSPETIDEVLQGFK